MPNYNFKNFFTEKSPLIHNEEYVSNKHFLIKKSVLKKSQLEYISNNNSPVDTKLIQSLSVTLENESRKSIITEFIPQLISKDNEYNTLITELDKGYKGCNESISKVYPAIQEEYYNFILSLKCKVFIVSNDQYSTLSIYDSNHEFVGIVLPVMTKDNAINEAQNYNEYLDQQKIELEVKKLRQENLKKCLYIKDNKAIIRGKELISIADITNDEAYDNLYMEKADKQDIGVYLDLGIICIYIRTIPRNATPEDIKYYLSNATGYTLAMVLENIYDRKNNNQFINIADIKLVELYGASKESIQELIDYRQEWYDKKHKEDQEKELKQEQEDKEYVESKNKIVEDLMSAAEQAIINKQEVKNKDVTVYKSKFSSNDISIILYMMKQYSINVPLKTQGWINQALTSIQYNKERKEYSYNYYKCSSNSTVFRKYFNQLVKVIKEKYLLVLV